MFIEPNLEVLTVKEASISLTPKKRLARAEVERDVRASLRLEDMFVKTEESLGLRG